MWSEVMPGCNDSKTIFSFVFKVRMMWVYLNVDMKYVI